MATADEYAAWIVKNADKKGMPDFDTVAKAYQSAKEGGAPSTPSAPGYLDQVGANIKSTAGAVGNLAAGALRGAGSIGATLLAPYDMARDALAGKGLSLESNKRRRSEMDGGLQALGADTGSFSFGAGKVAGEIAGTMGAGGVVANTLGRAPQILAAAPNLLQAIRTGGMTAGPAGGAVNAITRATGGAVVGGISTAAVDPDAAVTGAAVGAALPGVLQLAGKYGGKVYDAVRGNKPGAGKMLAEAMGVSESELPAIIAALKSAPDELVPGSRLTTSQALQTQGANTSGAKMLERVASGGPGGDVLLTRYADQAEARMAALKGQGAQTYQGAPREEATRTGDKIGAVIRTQAGDDRDAARAAWEALHGRASRDGVALELPLDAMTDAMKPLGAGTVGAGTDANALMKMANQIGTDAAPGIMPSIERVGGTSADKSMGQAVRALGIHPDELNAGKTAGEIRWLRESLKGGKGLVNKNGRSLDHLAEQMHEAGYLDAPDQSELIQKLAQEAQGSPIMSRYANPERLQYLTQGGDMPAQAGMILPKPVPFDEFQRLRRSAGALGAKNGERAGGEAESGVLNQLQKLLEGRVDDAAAGNLRPGEVMPEGFREQYNAARGMTRNNAERYKQGNALGQILRKPAGQDYTLTGDEITNKLWHGGAGLAGDVSNLKNVLSDNNRDPVMNALQKFIMTDAAGKTTASGGLGAALPRYVESRMPGLQEALNPEQLKALSGVAADIRNSEAAAAVPGLRGSDTHAKISRALDAGMLDAPMAKAAARLLSVKGLGGETMRNKLAELVIQHKGKTISELLANPKAAAAALSDASFVQTLDAPALSALRQAALRAAPAVAALAAN